jgi:hypothetical protein
VTAGVSASAGINLFGTGATASAGWKSEADWTVAHTWEKSKMNTQQVSIVDMKSLNVESLSFQIPARVRRCMAVKPSDGSGSGRYFCDPAERSESVPESWYYISQPRSLSTSLQDSGDLADNGWMKIIRGQEQYQQFRAAIQDSSKAFILERDDSLVNAAKTLGKSFGGLSELVPLLNDSGIPGIVLQAQ